MAKKPFEIHFALDALADVEPWGEGGAASLHWFGLTQGSYWIETPSGDLLRHTPEFRALVPSRSEGVDYQVARLFEDLLYLLPAALEPVPADVAQICAASEWDARLLRWAYESGSPMQRPDDTMRDRWDLYDAATEWWGARALDTAYLGCGPQITIWRVADAIHVRWSSRNNVIDGVEAFSTPNGEAALGVAEFEQALRTFFDGMMTAMEDRVREVVRGAHFRRPCSIDTELLQAEHVRRGAELRGRLAVSSTTDWNAVRRHLQAIASAIPGT